MEHSSWDKYFVQIAELISTKSKDRSTKVGAVLVNDSHSIISTGYNGFPRGVDDNVERRHERPVKYSYTEHAERNAIFNAAMHGIPTTNTTLYLNFDLFPCPDCARAIIQSGVKTVVGRGDRPFTGKGNHWQESFKISEEMFKEAGVDYRRI